MNSINRRWSPPKGEPVPSPEKSADEPMPWDAETLEQVIDRRFKALLSLSTDSKDLTKALEAATKWAAVKHEMHGGGGADSEWGTRLKGSAAAAP